VPVHITEFEGCHLSSPQAKPGQEEEDGMVPLPCGRSQVAAVQELLDFFPRDVLGEPGEPMARQSGRSGSELAADPMHVEKTQKGPQPCDHELGGTDGHGVGLPQDKTRDVRCGKPT